MTGRNRQSKDHGSVSQPSRLDQFADLRNEDKPDVVKDKKVDCK
jgi:hypothetical protein